MLGGSQGWLPCAIVGLVVSLKSTRFTCGSPHKYWLVCSKSLSSSWGSEKPEDRVSLVAGQPALMYNIGTVTFMSSSCIISAREGHTGVRTNSSHHIGTRILRVKAMSISAEHHPAARTCRMRDMFLPADRLASYVAVRCRKLNLVYLRLIISCQMAHLSHALLRRPLGFWRPSYTLMNGSYILKKNLPVCLYIEL